MSSVDREPPLHWPGFVTRKDHHITCTQISNFRTSALALDDLNRWAILRSQILRDNWHANGGGDHRDITAECSGYFMGAGFGNDVLQKEKKVIIKS